MKSEIEKSRKDEKFENKNKNISTSASEKGEIPKSSKSPQKCEDREEECRKKLQSLQRIKTASKKISACGTNKEGNLSKLGWTCLSIAVDSGACDNVIDPDSIPAYADRVTETEASINHQDFIAANGATIENYGELKLPLVTRERTMRGMVFSAAGVKKPLGSVEKMNEAGHIVVFDGPNSFIFHKQTQEVNMMRQEEGNFMLDCWVPPPGWAESAGFGGQP